MTPQALYDDVSYDLARQLTLRYSSSFGTASRLFGRDIQKHIYAIYGVVRMADEIVDTYDGSDRAELLAAFNEDVGACLKSGYSTNPIVHAFGLTARQFNIGPDLIDPFFASMATDLAATAFSEQEYEDYIYGSAEVIGLMCLRVFCNGDDAQYDALAPGARKLGSAYQKVNFLRDFAADYHERGRVYFPGVTFESWNDAQKDAIMADIAAEFHEAHSAIKQLPQSSRASVQLSYSYYHRLLQKLTRMSAEQIKTTRAHVPAATKLMLLMAAPLGAKLR